MATIRRTAKIRMEQNGPISDESSRRGRTPRSRDRDHDRARDAELVGRVRGGDPDAFGMLYDAWFDRVHDVARRIVGDPAAAADVTQDAFAAAWRGLDRLVDPASFGGWILRIARNGALDRRARDARSAVVDPEVMAMIERSHASSAAAPAGFGVEDRAARLDDPALAAGDAELVALVHEAAGALGARDAEVLHLQLGCQLTPAEVGDVLGLNRNAANQLCHRVRKRLAGVFGARLVWHGGTPRCEALRRELQAAGAGDRAAVSGGGTDGTVGGDAVRAERRGFDAEVARLVADHLEHCGTCRDDRTSRCAPAALFGAVGVMPALVATRSAVAYGLAAQGVPMHGSAELTGPVAGTGIGSGDSTSGQPTAGPATTPMAGPGPGVSAPEGEPATTVARSARGTPRWVRVVVVGAAVTVVVLVVVLALVLRDPGDDGRVAARSVTSTDAPAGAPGTIRASVPPSTRAMPGVTVAGPAAATATAGGTVGGSAPGAAPTAPSQTTVPPSTTTVAGPVVERFDVAPGTAQPAVWQTAAGPTLTWAVTGASDVTIWRHYDDGVHGDQRQRIVAQGATGSMPLCPGTPVAGVAGACSAPAGHYSYELVATGPDGVPVTAPDRPGFEVLAPVIR